MYSLYIISLKTHLSISILRDKWEYVHPYYLNRLIDFVHFLKMSIEGAVTEHGAIENAPVLFQKLAAATRIRIVFLFSYLLCVNIAPSKKPAQRGGLEEIREIKEVSPSSRAHPTVHRTVGFRCSNLLCVNTIPIKKPPRWGGFLIGGLEEIRTPDPHNANVVRSQLRYKPICLNYRFAAGKSQALSFLF